MNFSLKLFPDFVSKEQSTHENFRCKPESKTSANCSFLKYFANSLKI